MSFFGASYDVVKFNDVWMVKDFVDCILSFDFFGFDREEDFDGNFSSVFFIISFEYMRVFASAEFSGDGIMFDVPEIKVKATPNVSRPFHRDT